jgi:CRP-like cAMP-binding protein
MLEPRSRNHILSMISSDDMRRLNSHLERVDLPIRRVLEVPHQRIEHVYFPEAGLVSVVAAAGRSRRAEAGIIGSDGLTGHAVIMGDDRSPSSMYMQVAGHGLRISADILRHHLQESASLRIALHKFIAAFLAQASYTALAYSTGTLAERLARWLLMANDRIGGDHLSITHEFISIMLGVRRVGVTVALQDLVSKGLITTRRSDIKILDRAGLVEFAGDIYGVPEAEQARLTGWTSRAQTL